MKALLLLVMFALVAAPVFADPSTIVQVARGEDIAFSVDGPGSCWYFAESGTTQSDKLYDIKTVDTGNESSCELPGTITSSMVPGDYTFVLEKSVSVLEKNVLDISYQNGSFVSILSGTEPYSVWNKNPQDNYANFIRMVNSNAFNTVDTIVLRVEDPTLKISLMDPIYRDTFMVGGTSNLATGTRVEVEAEIPEIPTRKFRYQSFVTRDSVYQAEGTWNVTMILPVDDMAPDWHHLYARANGMVTTVQFPISKVYEGTIIHNKTINYLSDGNIAPVIVTITVPPVVVTKVVEKWHTATPTPVQTDALGMPTTYPYAPESSFAKARDALVGLLCLLAIVMVVVVKKP